jgi:SOS-response transcriptional repressor LexA
VSEFVVRLRGDHLRPEFRNGDLLTVREAAQAEEGQLAVVLTDAREFRVRHYDPAEGASVVGVVVAMNRRLP